MTASPESLPRAVFGRAHRFGRRWDEALWRWAELGAVLRLLGERPGLADGPILDLGCGDGEVFETVFGPRPDSCGVDSCATYSDDVVRARAARRYGEVREEDARRTSFEAGRFRLVFSNSVLEHVDPVQPVLEEAHRVLGRGGSLLFTTPSPRLYGRDAYAWRRALGRVGLDFLGRRMAERECAVYHHVTILDEQEWTRRLEKAGFADVEVRTYMPVEAALAMSRFSGLTRVPLLSALAGRLSPEARAIGDAPTEAAWVERCRAVLGPLLEPRGGGAPGCGLLVLARKP